VSVTPSPKALGEARGIVRVFPSAANFRSRNARKPSEAFERLRAAALLVRDVTTSSGSRGLLRITVRAAGTERPRTRSTEAA